MKYQMADAETQLSTNIGTGLLTADPPNLAMINLNSFLAAVKNLHLHHEMQYHSLQYLRAPKNLQNANGFLHYPPLIHGGNRGLVFEGSHKSETPSIRWLPVNRPQKVADFFR